MGLIAQWLKFYLFFFSKDLQDEPDHIHISKSKSRRGLIAKYWLHEMRWEREGDLTQKEKNELEKFFTRNVTALRTEMAEVKKGKRLKLLKLK